MSAAPHPAEAAPTTAKPPPPQGASQCMQVSLSMHSAAGGGWHARVVATNGQVLDFDSPFELVRFLSQAPRQLAHAWPADTETPPNRPGLR